MRRFFTFSIFRTTKLLYHHAGLPTQTEKNPLKLQILVKKFHPLKFPKKHKILPNLCIYLVISNFKNRAEQVLGH
jgi:hypothetical protein